MEERRENLPSGGKAPYRNLILAGVMGVGKRDVAQRIAAHFDAPLRDVNMEVETLAGMPPQQIRELFGEARLTNLESEVCREMALQRGAVVSVSASTMLNEANLRRLQSSGVVLVLTTALNEILRRVHADEGDAFHDETRRAVVLARLKQEWKVRDLPDFAQLDTTRLSSGEVVEQAIAFWQTTPEY